MSFVSGNQQLEQATGGLIVLTLDKTWKEICSVILILTGNENYSKWVSV